MKMRIFYSMNEQRIMVHKIGFKTHLEPAGFGNPGFVSYQDNEESVLETVYVDYLQVTVPCAMIADGDKAYLELNGEFTVQDLKGLSRVGIVTKGE